MQPGDFDKRISVDEPATEQAENGEEILTWPAALSFDVWASIEPLHGREALLEGGIVANIDTRIRMRWSPNTDRITAKWRLRFKGTVFSIVAPPAHINYARREIEIMANTGANKG